MKKGLFTLALALAVGIAAFFLTRMHHQAENSHALLDSMPELSWLHSELALSDAQFEKVSELHAAYRPQCAEMCHRIAEAQAKLDSLAFGGRKMTPEIEQAIQDVARVRADCRSHMLAHLYQTAALMDDQQSARYLKTVLPAALDSPSCGSKSCPHH